MRREPIVAGRFYPADPKALEQVVLQYLGDHKDSAYFKLAMVPHAGYMFSGSVCGNTLAHLKIPNKVILLGPNHTGKGQPISVWPEGSWAIPGGEVKVDKQLASLIIGGLDGVDANTSAHLSEHSLEVLLPFIKVLNPKAEIVPICVAENRLDVLLDAGKNMAELIRPEEAGKKVEEEILLLVSSDMTHYQKAENAKKLDTMALEAIIDFDPEQFYNTIRGHGISMCGVMPMTLAMTAAKALGATKVEVVAYCNSGDVSGDYSKVVGYAGVLIN